MSFTNLTRSRRAILREVLRKRRSAETSESPSGAAPTRRRRSTSSSSSQSRAGNSRTTTRRRRSTSSSSQSRSTNSRVSSRSRGAGTSAQSRLGTTAPRKQQSTAPSQSQSRTTTTRKRQSAPPSQSRSGASTTQNQKSVTSSSIQSPAAPAAIQQQTASQSQTRSVNGVEGTALEFTFGPEVGKFFADTIEIEERHGDIVSKTRMFLPPNYDSGNLSDLGDFIGKTVRIWQQNTGRYTSNKGDAGYDYKELYRNHLRLNSKQHVAAVTHWFYVNYAVEFNRIGSDAKRISKKDLWSIILDVIELDDDHKSKFRSKSYGGEKAAMRQIVNNHYACVIIEIRNPSLLQQKTGTHQFGVPSLYPQTT